MSRGSNAAKFAFIHSSGVARSHWGMVYAIQKNREESSARSMVLPLSKMNKKAIRKRFRTEVFGRDHHKCVICKEKAVDSHHIIDRSLWPDGGYIVDNGVSLCTKHHIEAEENKISTEHLRQMAGIIYVALPPGFDPTKKYNKWGKKIEENHV